MAISTIHTRHKNNIIFVSFAGIIFCGNISTQTLNEKHKCYIQSRQKILVKTHHPTSTVHDYATWITVH